jgi:hypothetical protein
MSFNMVKALWVPSSFVRDLCRSLRLDDEALLDLLLELKELEYATTDDAQAGDPFTALIDGCQNGAGRAVTLFRGQEGAVIRRE